VAAAMCAAQSLGFASESESNKKCLLERMIVFALEKVCLPFMNT
jgi:hypothetical protein